MKNKGCFTYILIIIISSVAALMLAGVLDTQTLSVPDYNGDLPAPGETDYNEIESEEPDDTAEDIIEENVYLEEIVESDYLGYYSQLNPEEQYIYDVVLKGANNGKKTFTFDEVNTDSYSEYCERAVYALTYDHPEMFWLQCGYSITSWQALFEEIGDIELSLKYYSYWEYCIDKNKKQEELNNAVAQVASLALKYDNDYERIRFVHDYLVKNTIYDTDALNQYYNTFHDASCEYIFSAYGCLVNGKTVCSGYAKAFQLIMQKLGYDCMYISGDAGGPHAWNCIFVEDEGYYVDITWDDPDYIYDEPKYEYFCITTEVLEKTHKLEQTFEMPECSAETYNYFEYYGFRLDHYDFNSVSDVIEAQKEQHIISVQFDSIGELEEAYNDLIINGKINQISSVSDADGISYSVNEDHCTLTIYTE